MRISLQTCKRHSKPELAQNSLTNSFHSYEGDADDTPAKPAQPPQAAKPEAPEPASTAPPAQEPSSAPVANGTYSADNNNYAGQQDSSNWSNNGQAGGYGANGGGNANHSSNQPYESVEHDDNYGPINVKEDG